MTSAKIKENSHITQNEGSDINQGLTITVAERRRLARMSLGHGKKKPLASQIGISRITLNNILKGSEPKPHTVEKIRRILSQ